MTARGVPTGRPLAALDALRGLAALYVVLHHAYGLLWLGSDTQPDWTSGWASELGLALGGLLRYGRQAVLLFFVLSGFCIHYRQAITLASRSSAEPMLWPNWRRFAERRFWRLYPVLVFSLLLTAALDAIGGVFNPDLYAYGRGLPDMAAAGHHISPMRLDVVAANLLVQADLALPHLGSNGPLWSLAYEAWFYAAYPIVLWLTTRHGAGRMFRVMIAVSAIGLLVCSLTGWWPFRVAAYWSVWGFGAFLAEVHVGRARLPGLGWLGPLAGGALMTAVAYGETGDRIIHDLGWSVPIGLVFAYGLIKIPAHLLGRFSPLERALAPLGTISYSLYATHYPLLVLLAALWLSENDRLPLDPTLAAFGVLLSLATGALTWLLVERWGMQHRVARQPTNVVASRLRLGLNRGSLVAGVSA